MTVNDLQPGQRVRVTQTIDRRDADWTTAIEGTVRAIDIEPTVSWYAHGKDSRVWLRRLTLQKPDGEISVLNVDQHTRFEPLAPAAPATP